MSLTIQNDANSTISSYGQNFQNLIAWVKSIPSSHVSQNYLALAVVIQQEVEPIITKNEAKMAMEGNVLSPEIAQSVMQTKVFSKLDPAYSSLLTSSEIYLKESTFFTSTKENVNKLSRVIFLISRTDKDGVVLETVCQAAIEELISAKNSITGPFNYFAQALISDESPCFPSFISSSEPNLLEYAQEISNSFEQPEFTLESGECLLLEKHFTHGEVETTQAHLSVILEDGIVRTGLQKHTNHASFADLRYESEESFICDSSMIPMTL